MAVQQWFVEENGIRIGPLSPRELRALVAAGRVGPQTRICHDLMTEYVPARRIKGLLPAPSAAAAAAPEPIPVSVAEPAASGPALTPRASVVLPTLPTLPVLTSIEALPDHADGRLGPTPMTSYLGTKTGAELEIETSPTTPSRRHYQRPAYRSQAVRERADERLLTPQGPALAMPAPTDIWPLAVLCLLFGWVGGGMLTADRMYLPNAVAPSLALALGGVPLTYAAIIHYLKPKSLPLGRVLLVAGFTAVFGILTLLLLQFLAAIAVSTNFRFLFHGSIGLLFLVLKLIGLAYHLTTSSDIWLRWVGFVFGVGLCEETVKVLPLVALIIWRVDRVLSVHTFLALGFASGVGFGIGEALYCYSPWCGNYGAGSNVIRWYSVIPSHAIYTTVCAAFLWRLADKLEYSDGFWQRAGVVATAAAIMAFVHGTYDTVCSLGVVVALVMDTLLFGVLLWVVRWVTTDATEPPDSKTTPWSHSLSTIGPMVAGLGGALVMMVLALTLSSSREQAMPAILMAELPAQYRPYIKGFDLPVPRVPGAPARLPVTAHFTFDLTSGTVSATLTNEGDDTLHGMIVSCALGGAEDDDSGRKSTTIGDLAPHASTVLDKLRGWEFNPGDELTISTDDYQDAVLDLP